MERIKCGIVGDGYVGKTSMLLTIQNKEFPDYYICSVYDTYATTINFNNISVNIEITDILGGEEDFIKLRQYEYSRYHIILVCFSLVSPPSYESIKSKWINEIREYEPNKKIVLIGMKSDLRDNFHISSDEEMSPISTLKGEQLKMEIKALEYVECSSLKQYNLNGVLQSIAKVHFAFESSKKEKKSKCLIA
ncbi:hypothetical protein M9Y10_002200 [Tritrichomonas musculus]|uniref:Uncharacterized protein n=1 Tax=Tritrichomonas musculus TaxID=1915356 RepID=A0ABR2L9I5_9EUKA